MPTNSFSSLKRNRKKFQKLSKAINDLSSKKNYDDDRFWKPTRDKAGNGFAVIRFLPQVEGEELPWVRLFHHAFQGPGGWYIENSRTTLSQKDPVSEANSALWNTGIKANQDVARNRKRKVNYISNIYVIKDPANPENEGKVFLYKYGKKIFDKISAKMSPEFEGEEPLNPFDLWEGANFKLKIKTQDKFPNYDQSEFEAPSALFDDDNKLEEVWKSQFPLKPFVSEENFRPYDELKKKFERVIGISKDESTAFDVDELAKQVKGETRKTKTAAKTAESHLEEESKPTDNDDNPPWDGSSDNSDEDDDTEGLGFFESLANDEE